MKEELMNMKVHEVMALDKEMCAVRVIGGWIYKSYALGEVLSTVFVPEPENKKVWVK